MRLTRLFVAALAVLGAVQLFTSDYKVGYMWIFWAVLLFFVALRHPSIIDPNRLSPARRRLGVVALIMFLLCFSLAPIRTNGL